MRTFYIFKIKENYYNITKNNPYNLYKALENIYYQKEEELKITYNFFKQISEPFNTTILDSSIFNYYKNDYTYTKIKNTHIINDYYTKEKTKLIINNTYLYLKSTKQIPIFLKYLNKKKNLFICDFTNIDYFWSEQIQ